MPRQEESVEELARRYHNSEITPTRYWDALQEGCLKALKDGKYEMAEEKIKKLENRLGQLD